jgi:tRNA(fMet)-specific endonuclease VapC
MNFFEVIPMEIKLPSAEQQDIYTNLIRQKIKVGRQDLPIAAIIEAAALRAIALSVNGILVTRNERDFSQVPNLVLENWTL